MIKRSKISEDRELTHLKNVFAKGGKEAIIAEAKKTAARLYSVGSVAYKSEEDMAAGFAEKALEKLGV